MNIAELFIRRPIMTTLVMMAMLIFGLMSYNLLPVSDLPNVDFPTIQVSASLPGASPETMASSVATPLEQQFSSIAGVDNMSSSSSLGSTQITLQFDLNRSIDAAGQDVQAAISKATRQLPNNMPNPPSYRKVNPADQPIIYISMISSILPLSTVNKYAETLLAQRLSMVNGVAQVQIYGSQKYAVRIQLDPQSLAAKGLGIDEVNTAISQGNANIPTGTLYGEKQNLSIQANGQLKNAEDYRSLIVAYRNGAPIKLGDIGEVMDSVENDKVASWYFKGSPKVATDSSDLSPNKRGKQGVASTEDLSRKKNSGTRAILLAIQRQPGTNTVEIVDNIKKILPTFREQLPAAIEMNILYDRSQSIRESVHDIKFTLVLTIGLVVMVIFIFLRNISATIIPSLAVPLSLVATFGVMLLLGYSLDNLSLMALTLSVGFVVDDAVVVLENIVRHMEMGESRYEAALKGAKEIGFTIVSMTISLVAVFIPMLFMGGILGWLFREFAVTISVAILVSGVISLSLTPMLCSRFLRPPKHHKKSPVEDMYSQEELYNYDEIHTRNGSLNQDKKQGYQAHKTLPKNQYLTSESDEIYSYESGDGESGTFTKTRNKEPERPKTLQPAAKLDEKKSRPWASQIYEISEAGFHRILSLYDWSLKKSLKYHRTTTVISVLIFLATIYLFGAIPKGFIPSDDTGQLSITTQAAQDISFAEMAKHQQALAEIVRRNPNIEAFNSSVGGGGGNNSANSGRMFIALKPRSERHDSSDQIVQQLRSKLTTIPGIRASLQNPPAIRIGGQQSNSLYQLTLQSPNQKELYENGPVLESKLREMPELQDVTTDLQVKNPHLQVDINREQASALGLTANQIETALNYAYGTRQVSTIYAPDSQYQVIMGLDPKFQVDASGLEVLSVRSSTGVTVPLNAFATITKSVGPLTINHLGQLPALTISFNLKPGVSLSDVTGKINKIAKETLPETITASFQGSAQVFQSSLSDLGWLLLVAIIVIYLVLGILYEDFIHPLTILSSLPSAGFGALLTLMLFGVELNIYAFVGIILLVGIVKKNGIMMIDFAIKTREDGKSPRDAIYEACLVRFRPIMMTTMAALMGTLPIALGLGAGAESRRPLGLAVVGGLLFSQLLTLYITPVFYMYMESFRNKLNKSSSVSRSYEAQ